MMKITFRGTGDAMGVPRVYCNCEVCKEARTSGINRRLRSVVQIDDEQIGTMLIDCGPDWGKQMEAAGLHKVDRILLTHAHFDHIGGLVEWADACRWLDERGEAYMPTEVIAEINNRFPWLNRHLQFIEIDTPKIFGQWKVSSWRVHHGKNGYSYAYRFDHLVTGKAWAYCSDAIGLTAEQQLPLYGLNVLILGTSFYKEEYVYETRSVYDVTEATELMKQWKPERVYFTHMSHDIDVQRTDYTLPVNATFAMTGMEVFI